MLNHLITALRSHLQRRDSSGFEKMLSAATNKLVIDDKQLDTASAEDAFDDKDQNVTANINEESREGVNEGASGGGGGDDATSSSEPEVNLLLVTVHHTLYIQN